MNEVLLIDDDGEGCLSLAKALKGAGLSSPVHAATTAAQALTICRERPIAVAVLDLSLDDRRGVESGFELLQELAHEQPHIRTIMLTGHGGIEYGVRALGLGAASFLEKPAHIPHLFALINDGIFQSGLRRAALKKLTADLDAGLVGTSAVMRELKEAVTFAAHTSQSIFLSGETGVGKGVCAQMIHQLSKRATQKFVRYQPNFSSADLVNSDLFGHRKGSFTGATDERRGLLHEANGGTLFLDEIDELPLETQVMLLGILQEKKFRPVGATKEEFSDFRLVAASNREIDTALSDAKLRRDFYHRIAQTVIRVPALRDRLDDLPELATHLLRAVSVREQLHLFSISDAAIAKLQQYRWPGNVRELQSILEGAAFRAQYRGAMSIEVQDIAVLGRSTDGTPSTSSKDFSTQVEDFKLQIIEAALLRNDGNQVKAAQELKLDRSSMRRILARGNSF